MDIFNLDASARPIFIQILLRYVHPVIFTENGDKPGGCTVDLL
jgi:hypothetical protein